MTIGMKLHVGFGVAIVLITVLSVFVVTEMIEFKRDIENYKTMSDKMNVEKDIQLSVTNVYQFITDASLTKDKKVIDEDAELSFDRAMRYMDQNLRCNFKILC